MKTNTHTQRRGKLSTQQTLNVSEDVSSLVCILYNIKCYVVALESFFFLFQVKGGF